MIIIHRGEDDNKPWLVPVDILTGSLVKRLAVGYSPFVLTIDKLVDLDTRIFDEAAKNTN
jgi:hypothetical protein